MLAPAWGQRETAASDSSRGEEWAATAATGKNPTRARASGRFLHHNKRFTVELTVELTATKAVCTSSTAQPYR